MMHGKHFIINALKNTFNMLILFLLPAFEIVVALLS